MIKICTVDDERVVKVQLDSDNIRMDWDADRNTLIIRSLDPENIPVFIEANEPINLLTLMGAVENAVRNLRSSDKYKKEISDAINYLF